MSTAKSTKMNLMCMVATQSGSLNVRSTPGGKIVSEAKKGSLVTITEVQGNWAHALGRGWVAADYLQPNPTGAKRPAGQSPELVEVEIASEKLIQAAKWYCNFFPVTRQLVAQGRNHIGSEGSEMRGVQRTYYNLFAYHATLQKLMYGSGDNEATYAGLMEGCRAENLVSQRLGIAPRRSFGFSGGFFDGCYHATLAWHSKVSKSAKEQFAEQDECCTNTLSQIKQIFDRHTSF